MTAALTQENGISKMNNKLKLTEENLTKLEKLMTAQGSALDKAVELLNSHIPLEHEKAENLRQSIEEVLKILSEIEPLEYEQE